MKRPIIPLLWTAVVALLLLPAARAVTPAARAAPTEKDEEETVCSDETGRRIIAFVERTASVGFSGSVFAAKGGKVVAATGVGYADLEGKVPNTPATLFEIASATKQFTAAAVLRLVEKKRLKLDDSIAEHLPGVPETCRPITVRHLLQHTSGIPGTNSAGSGDDLGVVLPLFLKGGPAHTPGTHWEYWNQGYSLLSEIIARVSGMEYVEFCRKSLFAPAEMRATLFTGDVPPDGAVVAVGRSSRGEPRSALDHPYGSYGFQYRGMGGAVSTVWDLWRWDRALQGTKVLNAASRKELFQPGLKNYALGWFVTTGKKGRTVQSHGGSVRGFVCDLRRYPEEDGCIFVLCNRDDVPVYCVSRAVEEILFGDTPTIELPPRPLNAEVAKTFVGRFEADSGAVLFVKAEGKITRAQIRWPGKEGAAGPVTRAFLGLDDKGSVILYAWTSSTPVVVECKDLSVECLSIHDRRFERVD